MPLQLNFVWENVSASTTLSLSSPKMPAEMYIYQSRRMQPRQAAFYRNLVRMAEQPRTRVLPVEVITIDGELKRLDAGCVKLAEHAGFILALANAPSGNLEQIQLAWNQSS